MLPTFIVIGAQKCATTTLWTLLRQHPDFFLSSIKEPNFFLAEGTWSRGRGWYESLFRDAAGARHVGEVSPGYTMFPTFSGVPERMVAMLPDVKLVYLVRDPVERMRSNYVQAVADGLETRPIEEALVADTRYVTLSTYGLQLEQYLRRYPRDQILVLTTEGLRHDLGATLDRLFSFFGVDAGWRPEEAVVAHRSETKRAPTALGRRVDPTLRRRGVRQEPWAQRLMDRWPLGRPFLPDERDLDDELRGVLTEWLAPDLRHFVELLGGDLGPAAPSWPVLAGTQTPPAPVGTAGTGPERPGS